jgi:hypothetical protein
MELIQALLRAASKLKQTRVFGLEFIDKFVSTSAARLHEGREQKPATDLPIPNPKFGAV